MPTTRGHINNSNSNNTRFNLQLNSLNMENYSSNPSRLPPNYSNQKLVNEDYLDSDREGQNGILAVNSTITGGDFSNDDNHHHDSENKPIRKIEWITVIVLCYVNLINYMDRFTIAGILDKIQCEFSINNSEAGLLQTAFVVSYMVFAPVFGYLGDRYSRKYLMAFGVTLWCLTTLIGSFMHSFGWFITFRALVGVGEASYSTIAPTIISDMFVDRRRSKMLALFYFAIPVGSGLGYIVGSETARLTSQWEWALRVTPIMGGIAVFLILFVMIDPARGESENSHLKPTSYKEDIIYLCKNPSFMLSTLGFTCVAFVAGALAWWGPTFITLGLKAGGAEDVKMNDVSFKFGLITMISGLIGVPLGSMLAQALRERNSRADPLVCAFGLLMSTPLLFFAAVLARYNTVACFTLIFFGELFLNLNWSVVADILLYVVIPTRRSTAEAFQILLSHALGDAGSPYIIGQVSEWLKVYLAPSKESLLENSTSLMTKVLSGNLSMMTPSMTNATFSPMAIEDNPGCDPENTILNTTNINVDFNSLQYSLFITSFVEVFGGLFFLITAWYIIEDKLAADKAIVATGQFDEGMSDKKTSNGDTGHAVQSTRL